jgi:hypothetical protein
MPSTTYGNCPRAGLCSIENWMFYRLNIKSITQDGYVANLRHGLRATADGTHELEFTWRHGRNSS